MQTRYIVIHRCAEDGCRCVDRLGVIAYDGYDKDEALAMMDSLPSGYVAEMEEL